MPPVDNEINGKLALVTGASGGIGKACATDLWSQGAHLALTYTTNLASVTSLVAALRAASPDRPASHISVHALDLASQASIEALFAALSEHHGRPAPDILVSNAGTAGFGNRANPHLEAISLDEFDYTIAINLRAAFLLAKLTVPHMKARRWGRIVYVSSISAIGGGINGCHYAASKAGLTGLMKNLAAKHAKDGITVNDVAPAMIGDTGMIPDEKRVEGTPGDPTRPRPRRLTRAPPPPSIGKACATDLWSQGAHLALTYTTNLASVTGLVAALRAASPDRPASHVSVHALDLASQASIEALFAALSAHHGRPAPDILVSNAGTAGFGNRANPRLEAISLHEFDYTIAINLRAAFLLAKLTVPHMKARRWGRIVYVSSISAIGGGITVNDVAPAMIGDTGMIPDEKRVEGTPGDVKNIPVGRLGTPQECANVVTMLCRTGYMTGQSILLSGGLK
ncbi:hypothetical protein BN1723_008410 [Verticillium longisporum]|uniref:Ketoreductase (KR) domain-containing protein n=1 Tax=Verticillium longisporum TaxID=100787 RepID=A0A0G4KFN1_VERLO|nr:hypothetical protein BN1723_008410 [Verticillium longisporum]